MTGLRCAAVATVLFCFGCAGETSPAQGAASAPPPQETVPVEEPAEAAAAAPTEVPLAAPTAEPPEAAYPPACGDYIGLLITLRQKQREAGRKGDVPQREQLELNYRREAAKHNYDHLAQVCAAGINMVMNQLEKVPPPTVPPDTHASPLPEP